MLAEVGDTLSPFCVEEESHDVKMCTLKADEENFVKLTEVFEGYIQLAS